MKLNRSTLEYKVRAHSAYNILHITVFIRLPLGNPNYIFGCCLCKKIGKIHDCKESVRGITRIDKYLITHSVFLFLYVFICYCSERSYKINYSNFIVDFSTFSFLFHVFIQRWLMFYQRISWRVTIVKTRHLLRSQD